MLMAGNRTSRRARSFFRDAALAAVEEVAPIASRRQLAQLQHEVRSVNAAHRPMSLQTAYPHSRHSVWEAQERAVENVPQSPIALRFHHSMNSSDADVAFAAVLQEAI